MTLTIALPSVSSRMRGDSRGHRLHLLSFDIGVHLDAVADLAVDLDHQGDSTRPGRFLVPVRPGLQVHAVGRAYLLPQLLRDERRERRQQQDEALHGLVARGRAE